ncbi:MAG: YitT family protein [Erysipelotrichaceae bacterium]|nr:YitT family protein [Erysipelotrichaceae bacterium]
MTYNHYLTNLKNYSLVIGGTIIYAIAVNVFMLPIGLYNSGVMGIAQIIRTLFLNITHLQLPFDIAGILYFIFNIPLFLIGYRSISKSFIQKTLLSVILQTILLSIIPIPTTPIMNDMLSNILIGAVLAGIGCGACLMGEACAGGTDILGMYAAIHWKEISVGKLSTVINMCIYICCALLFNIQVALYSALFSIVMGLVIDKTHLQNIELCVMIFTKKQDVTPMILKEIRRGVTCWNGQGAYTKDDVNILVTVISKYELDALKEKIQELDPNAFIIVHEGLQVTGGFEKRLVR